MDIAINESKKNGQYRAVMGQNDSVNCSAEGKTPQEAARRCMQKVENQFNQVLSKINSGGVSNARTSN